MSKKEKENQNVEIKEETVETTETEEVKELTEEEKLTEELNAQKDKYMRLYAEYDNHRAKR